MLQRTDDLRITETRPLIPPAILLEEIPVSETASNVVSDTRRAVSAVIAGRDPRLVVIAGPAWNGDYLGAGVGQLSMDLANFGSTDVSLRLFLAGAPGFAGQRSDTADKSESFGPERRATDQKGKRSEKIITGHGCQVSQR